MSELPESELHRRLRELAQEMHDKHGIMIEHADLNWEHTNGARPVGYIVEVNIITTSIRSDV